MQKFKLTATIPVVQYGNIMPEYEFEAEDFETARDLAFEALARDWDEYGEKPLKRKESGTFKKLDTFTGETILYNDETHQYTDLEGSKLMSGSEYKKLFDKPFDTALLSRKVGEKYGVAPETVAEMWKANSKISTTFGSSLHYALEQYFKHRDHGCGEKEYHMAKPTLLATAVKTFPLKDSNIIPEVLLSCVAKRMAGRADGLLITGEKQGALLDYKSDSDIKKNLAGHFKQLSFYAEILRMAGWSISGVEVWNYTDTWEVYKSEVLELQEWDSSNK